MQLFKTIPTSIVCLITLVALPIAARASTVDEVNARALALQCTACHGFDGYSDSPLWPNLTGLTKEYLVAQLKTFQLGPGGARHLDISDQMYAIANSLNENEIMTLSAYFSAMPANPVVLSNGPARKIYETAGCVACHGKKGEGNDVMAAPRLAGQYSRYLSRQLNAYQNGNRYSDDQTKLMTVKKLSKLQIELLANWLEGSEK